MDPVRLRNRYGKSFCMIGGIDKRVLTRGKKEIKEEILKNLIPLIEEGGYIPTVYHAVPPDVTLDNFRFYLELKWQAINHTL